MSEPREGEVVLVDGKPHETFKVAFYPYPIMWWQHHFPFVFRPRDSTPFEKLHDPAVMWCKHCRAIVKIERGRGLVDLLNNPAGCCGLSTTLADVQLSEGRNFKEHLLSLHDVTAPRQSWPWSSSLCDSGLLCNSIFCLCCEAQQIEPLTFRSNQCHCLLSMCLPCRLVDLRRAMVAAVRIDESACTSCATALLCPPCSIAQIHREMNRWGVKMGSTCGDELGPPPQEPMS